MEGASPGLTLLKSGQKNEEVFVHSTSAMVDFVRKEFGLRKRGENHSIFFLSFTIRDI